MASLRYAIHAYAAEHQAPGEILTRLSRLLSVARTGQMATILCAAIDPAGRTITLSSAGHLPPLLIDNGDSRYLPGSIEIPIGIDERMTYTSTVVSAPAGATLIAFTDGLVERRGESLDAGLDRLRVAATRQHLPLPDLVDRLVRELTPGPHEDRIAVIGVSWGRPPEAA